MPIGKLTTPLLFSIDTGEKQKAPDFPQYVQWKQRDYWKMKHTIIQFDEYTVFINENKVKLQSFN